MSSPPQITLDLLKQNITIYSPHTFYPCLSMPRGTGPK